VSASFAAWNKQGSQAGIQDSLDDTQADGQLSDAWGPVPDVVESKTSKVACPAEGIRNGADEG